ncbi:O-methyltransferase [Desulfosarcina ovata subsp. sediminis]|uniref:O-methyltransferase n=1 Tax=Desulfosarcina ovata subsp. sediminis TaxID=885957 RepID=A0A5K8A206_9BACT|nr:methyltransferase dimerization domain-containing protein [Desulfosarcina ovata]BBO86476.1 O-methyltransferase [Desulfosarcina ovata subsp. sediminis]
MAMKDLLLMNLRLPAGIEKLDRVLEGYQAYQALHTALELGVFEFLDNRGPSNRNTIAEGIGINGMFARDFLDTLVDMGFLSIHTELYANTKAANDFLLRRSPFFQGEWIQSATRNSHWSNLTASLRREQPQKDNFNNGPSAAFLDALGQRALRGELQSVTETISNWEGFYGARRLLDIGGGHGLYAIALCQANPHLEATVLDKPFVLETTMRYVTDFGMQNRIVAQAGDITEDDFGSGYDIVIVSHLLYKFRKNLAPIFDNVCACLNPGGLLVSNHWFCAPGCVAEGSGVQELAKALQSFGHPLCHVEDFDNLFAAKGLQLQETHVVPTAFGSSRLSLAVKEAQTAIGEPQPSSCCC